MSQTRSANPFRPGSGILPPLLCGREPETAMLEARLARTPLRRLLERRAKDGHAVVVAVDDIDLVTDPGDTLLQLRATALELYADAPVALVVAASPSLFGAMRVAHEPLVRFFEPIVLGSIDPDASALAIVQPLTTTAVTFDPDVVSEIVRLSGGRPYYLQKLAYHAYDVAVEGHLDRTGFRVAF